MGAFFIYFSAGLAVLYAIYILAENVVRQIKGCHTCRGCGIQEKK